MGCPACVLGRREMCPISGFICKQLITFYIVWSLHSGVCIKIPQNLVNPQRGGTLCEHLWYSECLHLSPYLSTVWSHPHVSHLWGFSCYPPDSRQFLGNSYDVIGRKAPPIYRCIVLVSRNPSHGPGPIVLSTLQTHTVPASKSLQSVNSLCGDLLGTLLRSLA